MEIEYRSSRIRKVCTNAHEAELKHGIKMAALIHQRIDEISASPSIEILVQYRIGRCHPLKGPRKEQYAMDLVQPYRLIFEKRSSRIEVARIMEIVDYH